MSISKMQEDLQILNRSAVAISKSPFIPEDMRYGLAAITRLINSLVNEHIARSKKTVVMFDGDHHG